MGMREVLEHNGYLTSDRAVHGRARDKEVFELLMNDFIPKLAAQKEPYVLYIQTQDTHTLPSVYYENTPLIKKLKSEGYSDTLLSFTWEDGLIHRLTQRMVELGMDKTSEYVLYGDHLAMRGWDPTMERNLTIFFPWRKQDEVWRRSQKKLLSYYDFGPTILKLLGVKSDPGFTYGADIFGEAEGSVPSQTDLQYLWAYFSGDVTASRVNCYGRKGFCRGVEDRDPNGHLIKE
jgi:phosphoglycerol transferase MdoB-like AlkP superfamily enzyme